MSVVEGKMGDEYFSSINGMNRAIIKQKLEFSSLLGGHWDSLPAEDQDCLLDEHFMPPYIQQKYGTIEPDEDSNMYPVLKIKCGQRIVEDDEGETWQDEHSGPFCWETSSQSEFSFEDDMTCTDTVKSRAKDPKRPKSPRHMRPSSVDLSNADTLERAGSSDFQQLRHIWETHHSVTPDGELPLSLSSFLSRSQNSLTGDLTGVGYSKRAMSSCSIDSIVEQEDEGTIEDTDTAVKRLPSDIKKDAKSTAESAKGSTSTPEPSSEKKIMPASYEEKKSVSETIKEPKSTSGSKKVEKAGSGVKLSSTSSDRRDTTITAVASLATKEDDNDITGSMRDDIIKMSEIQTKLEETLSEEPIKEHRPAISTNQAQTIEKPAEKEDILAKFGVTFSYNAERPPPKETNKQDGATSEETTADLPAGFDFLSAW